MNDLQLDYFMAVATNLSFTKTSEELFVSQPAISKQISQLEKELGAKLFRRNNHKTELTEVGKLYYDFFSKYKAELIKTKLEAEQIIGSKKQIVRVGFLEGWDLFDVVPQMIKRFSELCPNTEIVINCCGVKELTSQLLTDSIDVIVTMKNSLSKYVEFAVTDVAKIKKILIFSTNHKLADKDNLSLKDFSQDTFFAPWEIVDKMIIEAVSAYTRPYGFVPNMRFVPNHESTITCVRNNMGVAIADEWVWAKNAPDLKSFEFDAFDTVSIARMNSNSSKELLLLEEILTEIINDKLKK